MTEQSRWARADYSATCICIYTMYGKYVYSTLALEKEREIVKEETALRKEKEAVCCYVCTSLEALSVMA